ncbi:hypothetical protein M2140_001657 [Clostridiales Family XIII bacterium PM5-7]
MIHYVIWQKCAIMNSEVDELNQYLSLFFLYHRASHKKVLLLLGAIPLSFVIIFLWNIGDPRDASAYMLMERAFGGIWPVLSFILVNFLSLGVVSNALNGRKAMQATASTTGYTMRRLHLSPTASYLTVVVYYLAITIIIWGVAMASIYIFGKMGLSLAGATARDTKFALGLLRTEIGQALIPYANPKGMVFNLIIIWALAGECGKSCYLSWHNGRASFGGVLIAVSMILVWLNILKDVYLFMGMVILTGYTAISFWDIISRERHPKGDPFKANQYAGIMDLDSFEFDESSYTPEVNRPYQPQQSVSQQYGRGMESVAVGKRRRFNLFTLRRRFMPLGINLERANALFGTCIAVGIGEHLIFLFRYIMHFNDISNSIKGVTIAAGVKMPYFWELQAHSYYGYFFGILLVIILQTYWNYQYYNKKTKSVFVMKRLPDQKEYWRTIWVAPVIQAGIIIAVMMVHVAVDLMVYVLATPEIALYADYLSF